MLSKLIVPLVYLFITISSLVQSHELAFHHRSINSKRFLKNRQVLGDLAQNPPANSGSQTATSHSTVSDTPSTSSTSVASTTSTTPATATSTTSASATTASSTASSAASSHSTTASTSSPTSSSTATSTSLTSTSTSKTPPGLNLTPVPVAPSASVVASTITSTQSLSATTASDTPVSQLQSASSKTKSTTLTALIAVAASVGGIAILWTIFRKWKLSSSKKFDRRLNPITDWQPTTGEDDMIPALRRAPSSSSSFHSGGGGSAEGHSSSHGAAYGNEQSLVPPNHDFTAGPGNPAPIGGYADLTRAPSLVRAPSPNPPMQQTDPSFNHGYDVGVPLHYQTGYGTYDAYPNPYNGGGARY